MKNKNIPTANVEMAEREKQLIATMQSGNEAQKQAAFNELYSNRYRGLYNKIKVSLKNSEEDAQDVSQEVFIKVWNNIHLYNGSTNFSTWLYSIAKNSIIDFIRRQKFEIIKIDSMKPTLDDGADSFKDRSFQIEDASTKSGFDNMVADEHKTLVHTAIAKIKNDVMRKVIYMNYIQQMSGKEICESLNMNIGTYKANKYRAELVVKDFINKSGIDTTIFKGQKNKKKVALAEVED